jgi:hypothetical protein
MVRVWLTGAIPPPPRLFFRIVDLLQETDPDYGVPSGVPRDGS